MQKIMSTLKVDQYAGTWLGRKGVCYTEYLDAKKTGLRIIHMEWDDGGEDLKLIDGDGRHLDCVVYWNLEEN